MTAPTTLVWQLAGRPAPAAAVQDEPAVCAMCGTHAARTAAVGKALGANFTDPAAFARPDSGRVCGGCVWCCSGRGLATLRLWSIAAAPGQEVGASQPKAFLQGVPGLCLTSRADPAPVAGLLLQPPAGEWLVSVATSGQKHVLPYARVNRGPGPWTVRMEATDVTADPGRWRTVLSATARLRQAGHSADHVREGSPDPRAAKTRADLQLWRAAAEALGPVVRSPLLDLALWCCTKTTTPAYAALEAP